MSTGFKSERPIADRSADLLGRRSFAEAVARSIGGWSGVDSLVVAICGPWGSGKSSVKNMILDALRDKAFAVERRPVVVDFNPWMITGQEQLAGAFYREIGIALGRPLDGTKHEQLAKQWEKYAASVQVGTATGMLLPTAISLTLVVAGLLGLTHVLTPKFRIGLALLALLLLALGRLTTWMTTVAAWLRARARSTERPLSDIKSEVAGLLGTLDRPILTVIDDVDRLSTADIHLLFQLVKANADFPNLCFLLLLQREAVERALETTASSSGRDYLSKIVQVELDLPSCESTKVEAVLFSHLDQALQIEALGERFDQLRWQRLFGFGLRPIFRSLREVYRYANTLSFHLGLFRRGNTLEVNPVDLIGIEALRVFMPDVFRNMQDAKEVLTGVRGWEANRDSALANAKARIEVIVNCAPPKYRSPTAEILKELFPAVEGVLGGMSSSDHDRWLRELRVCASEMFDRYFLLSVPEGDISEADVGAFLSKLQDRDALTELLRAAIRQKTIDRLLARLGARIDELDLVSAVPLISSLLEIGDGLPKPQPGTWSISTDRALWIMIRRYLEREQDVAKRSRYLRSAIEASSGLYMPLVALYFGQGSKDETADPDRTPLLVGDDLDHVKDALVKRIRSAASERTLNRHPQLGFILYRWLDLAPESEALEWVAQLVGGPEGLMEFLRGLVHRDAATDLMHGGTQVKNRFDLKEIGRFVPMERLKELLSSLPLDPHTPDDLSLITAFREALAGSGQPQSPAVGSQLS